MNKELEVIVPIALEQDCPTKESIIQVILEQYERYGIKRFALAGPNGGWRSVGYPPREVFESQARLFVEVRDALKPYGIDCGWWVTVTVKSGRSPRFTGIVKEDGSEHPFANCPLDPAFMKQFAEDVARFAEIAHPSFIFTEDDYALGAAGGCYCPLHVKEFSRRMGRPYTREEIGERLSEYKGFDIARASGSRSDVIHGDEADQVEFARAWRKLKHDTMVGFSEAIRAELDKKTPEIPMGYMQSGASDSDGDTTEDICRALAGPNHVPFCRFASASYSGVDTKTIPLFMFHAIYDRQHIKRPFKYIQEADTYPHTRFYMAGCEMKAMMATAYSSGFDAATFQTQQLLDDPNEEHVYGDMFRRETARFNTVHAYAAQCERKGVEVDYDPFWNTYDNRRRGGGPLWLKTISNFSLPYTTLESDIAFWDERQALHADHETVVKYLSKGLFLDGHAAMALYKRGYGEYIGVAVEDQDMSDGMVRWDLAAREAIREEFAGKGKNMPSAHMFSPPGNGTLLKLTVTDPACEVMSDMTSWGRGALGPAMTRFENKLGGRIVVMGLTLDGNNSHSLFNYRRERLIQNLILWCGKAPVFVKGAPLVEVIQNEPADPEAAGFTGFLTLINLCADPLEKPALYLPEKWRGAKTFFYIDEQGEKQPLNVTRTEDGLVIEQELTYLEPLYVIAE